MRCEHPKSVHGKIVPCGHCFCCSFTRSSSWALRALKDFEFYEKKSGFNNRQNLLDTKKTTCLFGDLTYNNTCLPGDQSLNRDHWQKFMKRFRRRLERRFGHKGVRVLYSGEYGENGTHRPHFHFVMWNLPLQDVSYYRNLVFECWNQGYVDVDIPCDISDSSFYTAKYTVKSDSSSWFQKRPGESLEEYQVRTGKLTVPFVGSSVGLGLDFFKENCNEIVSNGYVVSGGYRVAIPRYYRNKMKEMLDYSLVREEIKKKLDYVPEGFEFDSDFSEQGLHDIANYLLVSRAYSQDVNKFRNNYSKQLKKARDLGFDTASLFKLTESVNLAGDCVITFLDSRISSIQFGVEDMKEFLSELRTEFIFAFFLRYSDLLEFRKKSAVEKWFNREEALNIFYSDNLSSIKSSARAFIDKKKIEKEFRELNKRRKVNAAFSCC